MNDYNNKILKNILDSINGIKTYPAYCPIVFQRTNLCYLEYKYPYTNPLDNIKPIEIISRGASWEIVKDNVMNWQQFLEMTNFDKGRCIPTTYNNYDRKFLKEV